ncbi:conserved hypothetical protein [Histoplasma capsulatum var. duboisii H88]|uniref:Uncharacterized protein n=2 Tax=Ajellomyces capsulatus TaxID=5037 RepID=F0UKN6_AJEC8|nr:conserved hypothetical protein [Histoplasma capsulatum H143]EGC45990.1 conserved hypothetical protein [Histoplasma capsulatum var. duboisii H88]QSS56620.1 hypothetical protein I7I53_04887 [Histoplasma capsulatum var. duboisii H88]
MGSKQDSLRPIDGEQTFSTILGHANPSSPRLSIDPIVRLPITVGVAFTAGMVLGAGHGSTRAAFRYRAENAHRLPTTTMGWYHYHRSKNYKSFVGGVKDGMKMGMKLGAGAFTFCLFEETVDHARHGQQDFLSTVTAGLAFSGLYSLLAHHDAYTAARTAKLGLKLSLTFGLIQDALAAMKGNRPGYIEFVYRKFRSENESIDTA